MSENEFRDVEVEMNLETSNRFFLRLGLFVSLKLAEAGVAVLILIMGCGFCEVVLNAVSNDKAMNAIIPRGGFESISMFIVCGVVGASALTLLFMCGVLLFVFAKGNWNHIVRIFLCRCVSWCGDA